MAPTAPDTCSAQICMCHHAQPSGNLALSQSARLLTQPFEDSDPFVLESVLLSAGELFGEPQVVCRRGSSHPLLWRPRKSCQIQRHSVWVVCCGSSPVHTEWHHKVHHWRPCARGGGGTQHQSQALWNLVHFLTTAWGLRCICVPAFHLHPAIVLVNLRDPRDVRIEACSRKAVRVSRDENRNTP